MRTRIAGGLGVLVGLAGLVPAMALAQQPPPAPAAPAAPPAAAPSSPTPTVAAPSADTTPVPVPQELLKVVPGGLTADQAGKRAAQTSWQAKASMEALHSAAAKVDGAWSSFLPRLSVLGKYTRLSDFTPPSLGSGSLVGTDAAPGTIIDPTKVATTGPGTHLVAASLNFPFFVLDNWLLQGSITVPISDYFLRINKNYSAATHSEDAARADMVTARAASEANGRLAYYTWLDARGAVIVAVQALNDQKTHLRDARNQFAAGNASKADVLRSETATASAELALEHAKNLMELSEKQLRTAMHASDDEALLPGEDLDAPVPPVQGNVAQMTAEAMSARPEIRSADANAESARQQVQALKAGNWPVLSAFADGILGNPNPRYIPPTNNFNATWDVGAQLTWSPNDAILAGSNVTDVEARVAAIEANKNATRDNISVEVTQALQAVREADFSIDSSTRELASAEEAQRVARELFNNGRGTATTLTDAESDLTRARLDLLNAHVSARTARIRLEHALGRDAHQAP